LGRKKRYRQKRHEQVHSLKSKSLFGHLVTELVKKQGFSQNEAKVVANPCFKYFKENLCDTAEGQIKFHVIDGINNHKRGKKNKKVITLTPITYSDIELLEELGHMIINTSLCGLGQTAPNPVLSTIRYFKDEYKAHIDDKKCPAGACSDLLEYVILSDKCIGCTACVRVCPVDAISGDKKQPHVIDSDKCIGCGECQEKCKFDAIVLR